MDDYIKKILACLDGSEDERVIFITVGPSGAGKSYLTENLAKKISVKVHCLDDYRIKYNNGKYPATSSDHDRINQIAIPAYREEVMKEKSRYILLDNTHLRWDPDWQLPLQKAKKEGYDIFPILPPVTEHFLFTNRSFHLGTGATADDIFI